MQFLSLDLFVLYLSLYFHSDVFNVKKCYYHFKICLYLKVTNKAFDSAFLYRVSQNYGHSIFKSKVLFGTFKLLLVNCQLKTSCKHYRTKIRL